MHENAQYEILNNQYSVSLSRSVRDVVSLLLRFTKGVSTYCVITFPQIFEPPLPFIIKHLHLVLPLLLLCQHRVNLLPPTLFEPKYNFKNKDATLRNSFRFVLLFCSMYLA